MKLSFNRFQKENLAKYFYVLSEILFGTLVLGSLVRPEGLDVPMLIGGVVSAMLMLVVALMIDRRRRK